jgi:hypothetical protein
MSVLRQGVILAIIVSRLDPHPLLMNESDLFLQSFNEPLYRLLIVETLSFDDFFEKFCGLQLARDVYRI